MARTHRLSTTGALIVCLVGTQWSGTLLASEEKPSSSAAPSSQSAVNNASETQERPTLERSPFTLSDATLAANAPLGPANAQAWRSTFTLAPVASNPLAQRGGYYRPRGRGGRNGAIAALALGAVASITGGAILVYANRPECSTTNHMASGCSYGTKVVGGAVLSAGIVGLLIGAATWR